MEHSRVRGSAITALEQYKLELEAFSEAEVELHRAHTYKHTQKASIIITFCVHIKHNTLFHWHDDDNIDTQNNFVGT